MTCEFFNYRLIMFEDKFSYSQWILHQILHIEYVASVILL